VVTGPRTQAWLRFIQYGYCFVPAASAFREPE
jgi:hypothetical protein